MDEMVNEEESLRAGSAAPDFTLPDQNGKDRSLSDYEGKWVFLYFYPHDNIARCDQESYALRNHEAEFKKLGVNIIGISSDSVQNHKHFAELHKFSFPLLSDPHNKAAKLYEVLNHEQFQIAKEEITQTSFLITGGGQIEKIYRHINPERHAQEVLNDLAKMQKEDHDVIDL